MVPRADQAVEARFVKTKIGQEKQLSSADIVGDLFLEPRADGNHLRALGFGKLADRMVKGIFLDACIKSSSLMLAT
jgi:hypothetical protein